MLTQEVVRGQSGCKRKQNIAWSILLGVRISYMWTYLGSSLTVGTVTECFQAVFFMLPPLLDATELREPLPCSEALWQASSEDGWHGLRRSESGKTSPL